MAKNRQIFAVFKAMLFALVVIFTGNVAFASCPAGRIEYIENGSSVCSENKFQITTIPNTTEIKFIFFAAGTYYVDCDINSTSDTVQKVTVEDSKSAMEAGKPVTCSYDIGGEYTIGFGGEAVNYIESFIKEKPNWYNAGSDNCSKWGVFRIGEQTDSKITSHASKIKALSGSIGKIFPTLPDKTTQPTFIATFSGTTNLTSIPGNLFNGVYGQPGVCMFNSTFYGTGAENIPIGLFSYINGTAEGLFTSTFAASKIKSIDQGILRTIKGPARVGMFSNMFAYADDLRYLPENLFGGIYKESNISSIGMLKDAFRKNSGGGIEKLPNTMFSDFNGKPDDATFKNIFAFNKNLQGEYIPCHFFDSVSNEGFNASGDTSPFDSIFAYTYLSASCPINMYKKTTGFEGDFNGAVVCCDCPNGGTAPAGSSGIESCSAAALVCAEGQYLSSDQTSCSACPSAYPNSPRGSHSISQCYATVTYKFNNGSDDISVDKLYSESSPDSYSIKLPEPSKIDYVFVGWNKNSNFSGNVLDNPATLSGNQTLYAQWTQIQCAPGSYLAPSGLTCLSCPAAYPNSIYDSKNIYACFATVTFYPNNDSDNTKENFYYTDATSQGYKIDKTPATNTEYEFTGWFDNISFSGTPITTSTLLSGNKNLYALYGYSIYYDLDGGVLASGKTNPSRYKNTDSQFTLNNPTKPGYVFTGWCQSTKTCANAQTNMIVDPATLSGNQNFYAKWTPNTYTVSFDATPGTGGQTSDITVIYDAVMPTISTTKPTRTGYIFVGWYDATSGGTQYYTASGESAHNWDKTSNATLYAQWTPIDYTITYDLGGGSATNVTTYNIETPTWTLNKPTKNGYKFVGWCETENCDTPVDSYTIEQGTTGDKTLYAKWKISEIYTIKYVDEDGNDLITTNPTQWVVGETESFDLSDPEIPEDWEFNAWYTDNLIYQDNGFGNKITRIDEATIVSLAGSGKTVTIYGYRYPKPVFWMTTTPMKAGDLFSFTDWLPPSGSMYVDWGDGFISKVSNVGNAAVLWYHYYKNSGTYKIGLSSYNLSGAYPNPSFSTGKAQPAFYVGWWPGIANSPGRDNSYLKVSKIEGSLGKVFPTIDNGASGISQPNFLGAFWGCTNLTGKIPEELFEGLYGAPANKMFYGVFGQCSNIGTENGVSIYGIPEKLFADVAGQASDAMFYDTFSGCSNLTGEIPTGLFNNVTGVAEKAFAETFKGATNLGKNEKGEATPIPENLFQNISGNITGTDMFSGTFADTQYLTAPVPTELFRGITGFLSDNEAGIKQSSYTAGGMANIFNNSNISTVCDAGQYQYLTGFEADWGGHVACEICPVEYPDSVSGDNVTMKKCYTDCPVDANGGEYVSGNKYWTEDGIGDTSSCVYKYTITYELNGADESLNSANPTEYVSNMDFDLTISNPDERESYSFAGWYDNPEFTGDIITNIAVGSVGNKTLYAQWTPIDYTITYHLDGGSATNVTTYNIETPTWTLNNPTKDNYEFVGWCETENCDEPVDSYTIEQGTTGDKTLYAVWTPIDYTITYYLYDGTVENPESYNIETPTWTLNNPIKEDYEFVGWCETENCTTPVTSYTIEQGTTGDKTLYAVWVPIDYIITYHLDGGSATNVETYNIETPTWTLDNPTKRGYNFVGWCETENCTTPVDSYTIEQGTTGNKDLYANWELAIYDINYVLVNGTNDSRNPTTYNINTETITLYEPTKSGYVFGGWYANDDFSGTKITKIEKGSVGDITLYAKWIIKPYTITYNPNNGSFPADMYVPRSYNVEIESDIVLPEPVRTGYEFIGWYDNANLTGEKITVITKGSVGNLIFWAKWEKKEYTIRYMCDEDDVTTDIVSYADSYTVRDNMCGDKVGYEFGSWKCNLQQDGSDFNLTTTSYWATDSNVDCEPAWAANKYTIVFDANTGTGSKPNVLCEYGSDCDITNNNEIVKKGYEFVGWGTIDDEVFEPVDGRIIVNSLTEENNKTITVYAVWSLGSYYCPDGYYLPADADVCAECKSGFYCPEGEWEFNPVEPQGNLSCATLLGVLSAGSAPRSYLETDCFAYCPQKEGYITTQSYTVEETSDVCVYPATIEYVDIENAANCPASSLSYVWPTNQNVTLCNVPQSRTGYTFVGFKDNNGTEYSYRGTGIVVNTDSFVPNNGVVTMTGIWSGNASAITYNCNNQTNKQFVKNVKYHDNEPLIDISECPNLGYAFEGWNCVGKTSGLIYTTTDYLVVPDEDVICDANWRAHSYNIEFDANTGTGAKANVVCEYNQNCDISNNNEITKSGYRFVGWSANASGKNSPVYSPTADNRIVVQNLTDEDNATITLYALWEIQNYNIRYEIGSARLSGTNPNTYNITTPEFTLNNPVLNGYQFKGWCLDNSSCNDPDTEYVFRGVENTGDKTFYAKFDAIAYTITYKDIADNGTEYEISGLSPSQYTVQDSVRYPTDVPISEHHSDTDLRYKFAGWSTNSRLSDTTSGFASGKTGDVTVYARWSVVSPKGDVIYDCENNRKITRTDYIGVLVTPATLEECRISDVTYRTFEGWNCDDVLYSATENIAVAEGQITCVPKWNYEEYTITYKDVAPDGTEYEISGLTPAKYTAANSVTYPTQITYTHHGDTRHQYKFVGWSTNSGLSNTTSGFISGRTGNITVYAKWDIVTPQGNVIYDCGRNRKITRTNYVGFNVSPATAMECRMIDNPDALLGWTCNGVDYALDSDITVENETINCVMKLKEKEPEILDTYNIIYKDVAPDGTEYEITGLTPNTYTKEDALVYPTEITYTHHGDDRHQYKFVGWSTNSGLSNTTSGFVSGRTGNITVYAKWNDVTPIGEVVYVCGNGRKVTKTNYVGFNVPTATLSECRISETTETTFDGWKCGDALYEIGDEITVAETQTQCVTQWTTKHYSITYKDVAPDGTEYEITGLTPNTYTKQDAVMYPTQITYTHHGDTRHQYAFAGWSTNADLSNTTAGFVSGRTGDITVYAKWNITTPQGTVMYNCGNNRTITRTDYVGFNVLPATIEECRITLDSLIGWTCDGVDYATDEYMTVKEGTTTCVANIEMDEYNLVYNVNGGTWSDYSNVKTKYTRLDNFALSTDIVKPNYDFGGWYLSSGFTNRITNIASGTMHDTVVYAKWTPKIIQCEAGYYLPSGTIVCKECDEVNKYCPGGYYEYSETDEDGKEICPVDYPFADIGTASVNDCYTNCPNHEHYTVIGNVKKYTNSCVYTPITYHINYVKNGGEFESDANVIYEYNVEDGVITALPIPVQTGKTFVGWFDENETNITGIDTSLATDITLYAHWVATPCDEDYYKASDGSCVICPLHSHSGGGYTTTCSCDTGYYWNSELQTDLSCQIIDYTITYHLDGGSATNIASYDIETPAFTLNNPIKEDYEFVGWCETENCSTPVDSYTIEQGTIGDKHLYAIWKKVEFECTSEKYLRIGENESDKLCLYEEQQTHPALAVSIAGHVYYISLSNTDLYINKKSGKRMKILYNGNTYNAHDGSVE